MMIKDRPEFKNKPAPFVLRSNDMVYDAVQIMAEKNFGSVVIVDDDRRVAGIVTERDFMRRLLAGNLDPKTTPLSTIMTKDVRSASPDDQVLDWLREMSNERFRHLPVIDADGKLLNVLSQGDFVSYTWPEMLLNLREKAEETFRKPSAAIPILIGGVMIYTVVVIIALRFAM